MKKTLTRVASAAAVSAVAGTGVAVAAAAPAQALDLSIWDKVAYCESTNNWSINTGNGFYGGVQFTISTWNAFGGQEFASRADYATKAEQITVARRVLAVQGPGAWPLCSKYAGLTKANGGADANATLGGTSTSAVSTPKVTTTTAVKAVAAPAPAATPEVKTVVKKAVAEKKAVVAEKVAAKKAVIAEKKAVKKAAKKADDVKYYTVEAGDSLFKIAQEHGIEDWQTIYNLNKAEIDDPDMIYVGQRFILEAN